MSGDFPPAGVAPLWSHPTYTLPLPEGHPFPVGKYRYLRSFLEKQGIPAQASPLCPPKILRMAHDEDYLRDLGEGSLSGKALRRLGFGAGPSWMHREMRGCGGTIAALASALHLGASAHLGGGTHHASRDSGGGFCLLNDVAVAVLWALDQGIRPLLIIDLDAHYPDGTARILQGLEDVFMLSVHPGGGYHRERPRFLGSSLDLEKGTDDGGYLSLLSLGLERIPPRPLKVALLVLGGDVLAQDRYGGLSLSLRGAAERDDRVISWLEARRIPRAMVLGGGYPRGPIGGLLRLHMNSVLRLLTQGNPGAPSVSSARSGCTRSGR